METGESRVEAFYRALETDAELRKQALELAARFPDEADQEKRIEAFIGLARDNGYFFETADLLAVLYRRASFAEKKC